MWHTASAGQHAEQLLHVDAECNRQLQHCRQASQLAKHTLFALCLCRGMQVVTAHPAKAVALSRSAVQAATAVYAKQGGAWVQTASAGFVLWEPGPVLMVGMGTMGVAATCCGPAPIAQSSSRMAWQQLCLKGPAVPVSVYAR